MEFWLAGREKLNKHKVSQQNGKCQIKSEPLHLIISPESYSKISKFKGNVLWPLTTVPVTHTFHFIKITIPIRRRVIFTRHRNFITARLGPSLYDYIGRCTKQIVAL